MFQHTAARRRLENSLNSKNTSPMFQHTAARRRLDESNVNAIPTKKFQHTAARRRLAEAVAVRYLKDLCFNTQPPEGGWEHHKIFGHAYARFQHTAARRRLEN